MAGAHSKAVSPSDPRETHPLFALRSVDSEGRRNAGCCGADRDDQYPE